MGDDIVKSMLKVSLDMVAKQLMNQLKHELTKNSLESIRKLLLAEVASQFSKEAAYNYAQYTRALGSSSVDIEFDGNPGEVLESRFKESVNKFEKWVSNLPPNSPVAQKLLETYGISGGASSYVGLPSKPIWEMKGYRPRSEPWLNRTSSKVDVSEMLSTYASKIFDEVFGNKVLSTTTITPQNVS